MARNNVIPLPTVDDGRPRTPAQKRFETLVVRIEAERRTLSEWQANAPAFRQAHGEALDPLLLEVDAATRQWALGLDRALGEGRWTAAEHLTLRLLLCEAAGNLLVLRGDDPELKALHDRHADVDFETSERIRLIAMKVAAERDTGLDLGDDDPTSEDELDDRIRMAEEADAARRDVPRARDTGDATRSVREVYRKLASALHPDRETDPVAREAKTALMQRVNQAHARRDLLSLLQLQLDIEQIDAAHVATASDQRLRHYNEVLGEQLEDLKDEVHAVATDFCMEFGVESWPLPQPSKLAPLLERATREAKAELFRVQCNLRMLGDEAATKRWLRGARQRRETPSRG